MIELHEFEPAWGINPSPFCLKVEVYLRLAGIPWKPVTALPFSAPRGKLPFIVDAARRIPDSGHIIAHLRRSAAADLDAGLDEKQQALGHLLRRTSEESLYFVLVYSRWLDERGWAVMRNVVAAAVPAMARPLLLPMVRRSVAKTLRAQGYGRHAPDEIYALGAADLAAIAAMIGGRPFAVADRPTSCDAMLYAFLASVLRPPIETPLKRSALDLPALGAYVQRVEEILAERR
ncbi:MAG TPA: glutathione S-transferase family protein [Stellaceae bacterium]|nr:glutathione S-transferase family protein [Stellaceae bacterium]